MTRAAVRFVLRLLPTACILAMPGAMGAQQSPPDSSRGLRGGGYTVEQAMLGSEVYALSCASCHTAATHTGPAFSAKWNGRTLWELFELLRETMPKNDPGSLSRSEYFLAMVYLLQVNGVPAGPDPLPSDSTGLRRIRIELKASRDTTQKR